MKLNEIADRIYAHLKRFEKENPAKEYVDAHGKVRHLTRYYNSSAYASGSRIFVTYVSFQGKTSLRKSEAEKYLAWLDAGNEGRHHDALREDEHAKA